MTGNQNTFQATWLCICFYLTVALETIFYSKLPIHAKSGNNRGIFFANHQFSYKISVTETYLQHHWQHYKAKKILSK